MKFWAITILTAFTICLVLPVYADSKCEGPPDLCAQVLELQKKLEVQKAEDVKFKDNAVKIEAVASKDRTVSSAGKMAAIAATLAIVLKMLLSALAGWKSYFVTDKGKAYLRLITVGVGFIAFIATNLGFGIPWWQALILALGGPGAILVHELTKIMPALRGTGPLPPASLPPPAQDPATPPAA
jgi:hypothetical protein